MSSTSRGYKRHENDYYVTPIPPIIEFLNEFEKHEPSAFSGGIILDPSSGGDECRPMSYPKALRQKGCNNIKTIDVREDSLAEVKGDYLQMQLDYKPNVIITNPPFGVAVPVIEKALNDVADGGFVIMLQRLNFFGSKNRKPFWDKNMPKYAFVHHRRISFTNDGKTDSIEYCHYVFQKGHNPEFTMLKVI